MIDRAGDRPFFLYLAHQRRTRRSRRSPTTSGISRRKLRPGLHHQNPVYAAMVKSLDDSVGRVLEHLKKRGLDRTRRDLHQRQRRLHRDRTKARTVPVTSNAPLRSGKGSLYEGGIRVPLIVRWPGVTPAGAECREPVVLMDLFHTLAAAVSSEEVPEPADGMRPPGLLQHPARPSWTVKRSTFTIRTTTPPPHRWAPSALATGSCSNTSKTASWSFITSGMTSAKSRSRAADAGQSRVIAPTTSPLAHPGRRRLAIAESGFQITPDPSHPVDIHPCL